MYGKIRENGKDGGTGQQTGSVRRTKEAQRMGIEYEKLSAVCPKMNFQNPGFADGIFKIRAKGSLAASLYWTGGAALSGSSAFVYLPIESNGVGI